MFICHNTPVKTVIFIRQEPEVAETVVSALKWMGYFIRDALHSDKWEPYFEQVLSFDTIVIIDDSDTGMVLCKQLRDSIYIPILALSSRSDMAGRVKMLNAGADDLISLPIHPAELAARLDAVLRRYERRVLPYHHLAPRT